ncbi:MAG: peptidase S41 [Kordia sp.]|nr:MAG: peptidase S41 [Kordia sp.]
MTYKKKYLPLIIGLTLAIGFWGGGLFHFNTGADLFVASSKKQKLSRLIDYIDNEYVDDVNTDSIVDVAVNEILGSLDPHSVYIPKKKLSAVTESMNGEFVGIGISFYVKKDTISVIKTIAGGPSEKVGIAAGDKILIADKDTLYGAGITNEKVIKKLKGEIDSKVALTIYRASEDRQFSIVVTRGVVPIKSVPIAYMVDSGLGYIKINRFAETTYREFKVALKKLKSSGMTSLVLDLRGNPGGFLDRAQQIVDEFLEDDKLILFTKNKKGEVHKFFATEKGNFEKGDVFVLIDEESASASEIVAGALQDNDKGTIVGRRSFGKGLVQREMQLGDGSAIRLTVSRYYTPTGRSIQKPYTSKNDQDYYDEYRKRYLSGELTDSTRIEVADSLKFITPKGKVVYGGGGIIPDVFVPIDANGEYEKVYYAINSNLISNFVFFMLEKDRKYYNNLTKRELLEDHVVSEDDVSEFIEHVYVFVRRKWTINGSDYDEQINRAIKAEIASQLFDDNLAYQIKDEDDMMIQKVKELLLK